MRQCRNGVDIQQTLKKLKALGVRVRDATRRHGPHEFGSKMLLGMLAAFAEIERDLIVERTQAGLARARAQGVRLGRPSKTTENDRAAIRLRLAGGDSVSAVARSYAISRASVIAIREGSLVVVR